MTIFEKLGYTKIQSRMIHEIIKNENEKYKNNQKINKNNLIGGGSYEIFKFMGHKIKFEKIKDDDQVHYSLNTLDKNYECLVIIISKNEANKVCADIHQISINKTCPIVGKMKSGGGSLLLKIGIEFIKSIKKEHKIKIIQIKDNSEKFCKKNKIKLWLLNTLTNGVPWHIKYDFEPYDIEKMELHETNKIKIIANLRILKRTKTSIIKEENLLDIDENIEKIYKKYKNNTILDFFSELMQNKNNYSYIEDKQETIIEKLLLFDMTGISYYINLEKYS